MGGDANKPITHQADLTKLPRALAPLIERPQWAIWKWTQLPNGGWQKPPFVATRPDRHVSTSDPNTWTNYATALAAVQAGYGDGITYILSVDDPFAAIDIDHCRHVETHSIDPWAQLFMQYGVTTYQEVTPSGEGVRIWGLANGATLNRKLTLTINEKEIAVELFRRTNKALTITGYKLDTVRELTNIDNVIDWGIIWGERRKAAAADTTTRINGHHLDGNGGCGYSIDQIEEIVRNGAPEGANRSNLFHTIIGHYTGCGWTVEQILQHLEQHPHGIGERYIHEGRLHNEIARSAGKFAKPELPSSGTAWSSNWEAKAPPKPDEDGSELEQDHGDDDLDNDLGDEGLDDDADQQPSSDLPQMYCHGDPDPRPIKNWAIKHLMPTVGHGVLGGQWGTYKTFIADDLAACLMTGQLFLGHMIKRQCGVLFFAAEGAGEVRERIQAVVNAKCGGMSRAPFCWYETVPLLLHKGSVDKFVAMGQQAHNYFQNQFGLPLGLIEIDTMAVAAGYQEMGAENDSATVTAVMRVLKDTAERLSCFVLGVDHYGKNIDAGLKGSVAKETQGDLILACLGDRERSGRVINTRLAVRKCRSGPQGQEFPFTVRSIELPDKDEDGEPYSSLVIDWQPAPPGGAQPQSEDPWAQPKRQDQRTAVLRLKRVLMSILAEKGLDLPIPPDGPVVRMIDQEIVREQFYAGTPADGTTEQKGKFRRQKFSRALDWAEDQELIGIGEIDEITYVWLVRQEAEDEADGEE
jgi:hypothetical protein